MWKVWKAFLSLNRSNPRCHKYFIANISNNSLPKSNFQESEVSRIDWIQYNDTINHIRKYNLEKIDLIKQVNKILERYNLYS